jgi:hypothetical protein
LADFLHAKLILKMKKLIYTFILLIICLSNSYAQSKPPKHLCQKWRVDTVALREAFMQAFKKESADDQTKEDMMLAFLNGMVSEFAQMWIVFHKDGTAIMHSPQETERGTWAYEAKTKNLSVISTTKNSTTRFIIQEITAKKMVLQEKDSETAKETAFKTITFIAEK